MPIKRFEHTSEVVDDALRESFARQPVDSAERLSLPAFWGNLVPDAYRAALAIESGGEWITADRDFSRFPGLRWRHPITA